MKLTKFIGFLLFYSSAKAVELITNYDNCDCGYFDPDHQAVWQEIWHINFESNTSTTTKNVTRSIVDTSKLYSYKDLFFANYQIPAKYNDSYSRTFKRENVDIYDNALQIGIHSQKVNNADRYDISCGGLGTGRQDFLYGSFRSYIKTTSLPGTVMGMFVYHPEGEIDIELISAIKPAQAYFAMHPQIYDGSVASPVTHGNHTMSSDPSLDYHEYRFDWFPNLTIFYVDGAERYRMTTNVLAKPSRVMFNHWTDGNPNFSQGPVKENATISMKNITIFFNSSLARDSGLTCQSSSSACSMPIVMSQLESSTTLSDYGGNGQFLNATTSPIRTKSKATVSYPNLSFIVLLLLSYPILNA